MPSPRTPEEFREYNRNRQRALRAKNPPSPKPFVGVDGEGGTIRGRHLYFLLRAGDYHVENTSGLTPTDCLDFLSRLPNDAIYISYYFDYDVTMICRALSENRLRRLLDREGRSYAKDGTRLRQPFPVDIEDGAFQIDYLPRKFFKVRRRVDAPTSVAEAETSYSKWVEISDISAFFQCSFVKALTDWEITDDETLAAIQQGKDGRSNFGRLTEDTRRYNALECVLLANLGERFREVCTDVGYSPAKWQGPGYLAVAMFRAHGIPKTRDLPAVHPDVWEAANAAYYGGRFEVTGVGPVRGPIYQYDINSAYPDAIRRLPCLIHSRFVEEIRDDVRYTLQYGEFTPNRESMLYSFPIRDRDGGIYFPGTGAGWYWGHEIAAAIHQDFIPVRGYSLVETCECRPFHWVPEVYQQRITLGKTARGKILKLGLNSLYGKTAQSIGGAPYANPVYASLITSLTRTKLMEAVHSSPACALGLCGQDVYMLATDAVFTGSQLPLPVSKDLGEWDLETHPDGMFIIQPGVYFTSDPGKPKTRGLPQRVVVANAEKFRRAFQDLANIGDATPVPVCIQSFTGLRQALHRNKLETAGTWVQACEAPRQNCGERPCCVKQVSFDWKSKRDTVTLELRDETAIRPLPIRGMQGLVSVPYSKEIGRWRELEKVDYWDQPDFGSDTFREGDG